jgi:hypothetical protein
MGFYWISCSEQEVRPSQQRAGSVTRTPQSDATDYRIIVSNHISMFDASYFLWKKGEPDRNAALALMASRLTDELVHVQA